MKKIAYIMMVFTAVIFIYGCEGPEGEAGPQGIKGDDGEAGIAGEAGENGIDGIDGMMTFDPEESTSTGGVKVVFEGILSGDNVKDSIDFQFNYDGIESNSSWEEYIGEYSFRVRRTSNMLPIGSRVVSSDELELTFSEDQGDFDFYTFDLNVALITAENKFCELRLYDTEEFIEDITNYSFDPVSGNLKMTIHVLIPAEYNITEEELKLTAYVDVVVFESEE